jgi:hypothetical protein
MAVDYEIFFVKGSRLAPQAAKTDVSTRSNSNGSDGAQNMKTVQVITL